jgi:hypothetical protein
VVVSSDSVAFVGMRRSGFELDLELLSRPFDVLLALVVNEGSGLLEALGGTGPELQLDFPIVVP